MLKAAQMRSSKGKSYVTQMPRLRSLNMLCEFLLPSRLTRRERNISPCVELNHRSQAWLSHLETEIKVTLMTFKVRCYLASVQMLWRISTGWILTAKSSLLPPKKKIPGQKDSSKHIQSSFEGFRPLFPHLTNKKYFVLFLYFSKVPSYLERL